ncbi:phage tail protein [Paenibacillus apiarius]|uniref:phage tail-collar fiber domain-containing protein n=1 Tax=Paenibacillus apiarius TaxID=46240 RepID=UPI003B3AC4FC
MGAFGGIILTNKGRNLQAKAQTGVELKYTRVGVGDGQLAGQSIPTLTKLISEKKSLPLTKLKLQGQGQGKAVVGTVLSNQEVSTGFYFRELGIYAQDPDEGEILYGYGNSGANAEYIPPAGGADIIEKSIDVIVIVGQAQNVSAVIDSSLVWATQEDVSKVLSEAKSYTDQKVADIDLSKITPESIGAETPAGAQEKANLAETNAKSHADTKATQAETNAKNASVPRSGGTISGDLAVNNTLTVQGRNVLSEIDSVKQSGDNAKQAVVDAIVAKGGQASINDSWADLAAKIRAISTGIKNNYMLLYYRYFLNGDTAPVFTHGWAPGYISGNTGSIPDNSKVSVHPDNGFVNVHAGNQRQPGRAQVITQQPVDLTNVGYIEFGIDPYRTQYKQGLYVTVGVTPTLNPTAINYSKYSRFDVGYLADKSTVSLDVRDLTGMHYVGMDTEATVFNMYVDSVNFFAVRLIQGR